MHLSLLLLSIAACFGAPTRELLGSSQDQQLPSTMLAAKVSGSGACVSPVHSQGARFDCVQTLTVNVPKPTIGEALVRVTKGAYAEYAIVICGITSKLGEVSPRDVGTLPEVSMTSAQALKKTGAPWGASKNMTVVVTSGSGGTGIAGVQLAKAYGAGTVVTATGSEQNIVFLKSIGADVVVNYHNNDIFSTLANNSVDVVYDNYGAPGTADKAMTALKPGGVFIFLPGKGGSISKAPKHGVKQINYGLMIPCASLLDELLALYKTGKLKTHIQDSYPLTNVSGAFMQSAGGHVLGKLEIAM